MSERNEPTVSNPDTVLELGGRIRWGRNVVLGPRCRRVSIGFGAFIGNDLYIDVEELEIGDYFTMHHGGVIHGRRCLIGHNCWIGHYSILDALGGLLRLGNNVGVGAHSQLWSHLQFGDLLAGCRWYRQSELIVGDDAWFVGHTIAASIHAAPRSMLMVGGVAVKDLEEENHVYAGSPAKDVTDRMGPQFGPEPTLAWKEERFAEYLREFAEAGGSSSFVVSCDGLPEEREAGKTYFDLSTRTYAPRYTCEEYELMKFLLYERAKFVPEGRG